MFHGKHISGNHLVYKHYCNEIKFPSIIPTLCNAENNVASAATAVLKDFVDLVEKFVLFQRHLQFM